MKAFKLSVIALFALIAGSALAHDEATPANAVMASAFAKAKAEKKTVMLSFHASWCGWCHKFEDFLKIPQIKKIWDDRFVMVWLTVLESPEKKSEENPGGDEWLKKTGGENGGIPFIALFDGNGKMLVNSNRPADPKVANDKGGNTGYPAAPEEIGWFMSMLKNSAKNVTAAERATIEKVLRAEAAKIKH
ncbi:MAG: thioredoxin family protein [Armatimonadetes bacterium]|nr:thioredoxin family protein [Armatimonadota bacterium]